MRKFLSLMLLTSLGAHAQQTSVLFLGNSYTSVNDLPNTFRQLALSLGETVNVGMHAPGGYMLEDHSSDVNAVNLIASQPWDFVVLQEQSQQGAFPNTGTSMGPSAAQLAQLIEANNECAWPVFYMTWGRENGDALSCVNYPFMCTYASMQQALRDNYVNIAVENDAYAAPVGMAWKQVRDDYPAIDLYQADGSHPNVEGTYLAACVFYCTLFKQPCTGATFTASLPAATAAILQNVASATVLDSLDTWNLNVANGTDASFMVVDDPWSNDVTCHHPGQGTHAWTCSNGQTSTDSNPMFSFDSLGIFLITHVYADPCGNSDTATWYVEAVTIGIAEEAQQGSCTVQAIGTSMVEVFGIGDMELWIGDPQGRTLLTQRRTADHAQVPCPSGFRLWRIRDRLGNAWSGKVVVP